MWIEFKNETSWEYIQILPYFLPSIGKQIGAFCISFGWLGWAFVVYIYKRK